MIFSVIDVFPAHVRVMDIIHLLLIPADASVMIGIQFRRTILAGDVDGNMLLVNAGRHGSIFLNTPITGTEE